MIDEPLKGVPSPQNELCLRGEVGAWFDRPPMTDAEWAERGDPREMLSAMSGRFSNGVLRLFAAACVRWVCHLLREEVGRRAVEQFAAGLIGDADLAAAKAAITNIPPATTEAWHWKPGDAGAFCGAWYASGRNAWYAAWFGSRRAAEAIREAAFATIVRQQVDDAREAYQHVKALQHAAEVFELAVQASFCERWSKPVYSGNRPDKRVQPDNF
jgi:histone H3/H4